MLQTQLADVIYKAARKAQKKGDLPKFVLPEITINRAKRDGQGDFSAALALQIIREVNNALKENGEKTISPLQVAEIIARRIEPVDFIGKAEAVKPGFVNLYIDESWLAAQTGEKQSSQIF